MANKEIHSKSSTAYNREIICPYCGHENSRDECDLGDEDSEIYTCDECDKDFEVVASVERTFSTTRIPCKAGEHTYNLDDVLFNEPYIYNGKNWTVYKCATCLDELILTGPVAADGKPYTQPVPPVKEATNGPQA